MFPVVAMSTQYFPRYLTARSSSQPNTVLEIGVPCTPSVLANGSWTTYKRYTTLMPFDFFRDQSSCYHVHRRRYVRFCYQEVVASHLFPDYCPSTLEYIKRKFMGKADQLFKIYISLHTEDHWYLMIIDFFNWKLVYLDLLKDSKLTKSCKDKMLYMAFFLENLLYDDFFYERTPNEMHKPSTYEIVEPEMGQQADGLVWVAQWMIQSHLWSNYDLPVVNEHTRMRLAVDIVLRRHNPYRAEISWKVVEY
ncbi:hypothetical protein AHAS_Ahas09G0125300 [Arachis hypogaea]